MFSLKKYFLFEFQISNKNVCKDHYQKTFDTHILSYVKYKSFQFHKRKLRINYRKVTRNIMEFY